MKSISQNVETVTVGNGKYTVVNDNGKLSALRNGEPWARDLVGDNLVYWMMVEILRLQAIVQEVHAWAVCAPLATPDDMAQNLPRVVEITAPGYRGDE
jgi:hypothetical protein